MPLTVLPGDYRPGVVVSVPVPSSVGRLDHKGIVTEKVGPDGYPMVIHASHHWGRVVETTMSIFAKRAVGPVSSEGYPGALYASQVLARARARLGQPWKPTQNCEHFVTGAHGVAVASPQLVRKVAEACVTALPTVVTAYTIRKAFKRKFA